MSVRPFTMWGRRPSMVCRHRWLPKLTGEAKAGAPPLRSRWRLAPPPSTSTPELMVGMDCLEKGNDPAASLPRDKSCQKSPGQRRSRAMWSRSSNR